MEAKWIRLEALLCLTTVLLTGCTATSTTTTPHVLNSILTSGESLSHGKRSVVQSFTPQDFVVSLVDFQWDAVGEPGGSHVIEWRWYQNDTLLSKSAKTLVFTSTPYTTRTQRAAATLGTGHFRVETLVDGVVATSHDFNITPQ